MNEKLNHDFNDYDASADTMIRGSSSPPVSPRAAQRVRYTKFIWNRFINTYPIDEWKPIKIVEKPDVRILEDLLAYSPDLEEVRNNRSRIREYISAVKRNHGTRDALYEQVNYSGSRVDDYNGASRIGRAYTKSFLQNMQSGILKSLYRNTHVEVDIQSSFPIIVKHAFSHLELPSIDRWLEDEKGVVSEMRDRFEFSRSTTKKAVIGLICSGSKPSFGSIDGFYDMDEAERVRISNCPFFKQLALDSVKIAKDMEESYPLFMEMCGRIRESNPRHLTDESRDRTAIFLLLADIEHFIMRNILKYLYPDDIIEDVVWKFDGLLLPRSIMGEKTPEEFLVGINAVARNVSGINISLQYKDLSDGAIPVAMSREELTARDPYREWKREFEQFHFYVANINRYVRLSPYEVGMMTYFSHTDFKNYLLVHKEFGKQWFEDKDKRHYESMELMPPPLECPDHVYNLWRGFKAELLPEIVNPVNLEIWHEHLRTLAGAKNDGALDSYEYFDNTIAHIIQKPAFKTKIMNLFVSGQGTGKDLMADIIFRMIGVGDDSLGIRFNTFKELLNERGSARLQGKIFVVISETDKKDVSKYGDSILKALITEDTATSNAKYMAIRNIRNLANIVAFSNSATPVNLDEGDRRFHVMKVDGFYVGKHEYFDRLVEAKEDDRFIRALFDYYKSKDISSFDPRKRPITQAHTDMVDISTDIFKTFMKTTFLDIFMKGKENGSTLERNGRLFIKTTEFGEEYLAYAKANNYHKDMSDYSIKTHLRKLVSEANMKWDKYRQSIDDPPTIIWCTKTTSNIYNITHKIGNTRYHSINIDIMKKILELDSSEQEQAQQTAMARGFFPGRGN